MVEEVDTLKEFKRKVRQTPDIARLEHDRTLGDTEYFNAFLSSDVLSRIDEKGSASFYIDPLRERFEGCGAASVEFDGNKLILGFAEEW